MFFGMIMIVHDEYVPLFPKSSWGSPGFWHHLVRQGPKWRHVLRPGSSCHLAGYCNLPGAQMLEGFMGLAQKRRAARTLLIPFLQTLFFWVPPAKARDRRPVQTFRSLPLRRFWCRVAGFPGWAAATAASQRLAWAPGTWSSHLTWAWLKTLGEGKMKDGRIIPLLDWSFLSQTHLGTLFSRLLDSNFFEVLFCLVRTFLAREHKRVETCMSASNFDPCLTVTYRLRHWSLSWPRGSRATWKGSKGFWKRQRPRLGTRGRFFLWRFNLHSSVGELGGVLKSLVWPLMHTLSDCSYMI